MKTIANIEHKSISLNSSFEVFTFNFEQALGLLSPADLPLLNATPASIASNLFDVNNEHQLVLCNILEHKDLLYLQKDVRKLKQYHIGNISTACILINHNAAAALYVPLRILVYENDAQQVNVEYELPSSQFARFNDMEIHKIAVMLDEQLSSLISKVDSSQKE